MAGPLQCPLKGTFPDNELPTYGKAYHQICWSRGTRLERTKRIGGDDSA